MKLKVAATASRLATRKIMMAQRKKKKISMISAKIELKESYIGKLIVIVADCPRVRMVDLEARSNRL